MLAFTLPLAAQQAEPYRSQVWVADQGDGTYKNPVLYADYSDPDACRVGDDFYLTSSSFNCVPGLQILHSKDLVNWTIIGSAVPWAVPPTSDTAPQHGKRIWAPCIRHHDGWFYIFWGDPDQGAFMVKAQDPRGPWTEPVLVKPGIGIIDTTPLWDDDGRVYMAHAYAGSRAQLKSVIAVCELSADASRAITPSRIVFDGHEGQGTCEGPKFYKRGGYYYIFHPAGGVPTGFQTVQRSKHVYGPYENRIVLAQGKSPVNGPHQGAWVDTPTGEDWFLHFQDVGAYGRLVHLQPMRWVDDWPVIGIDDDGDGCGDPVLTYKKPNVGKEYPICTPQESDEFYTLENFWSFFIGHVLPFYLFFLLAVQRQSLLHGELRALRGGRPAQHGLDVWIGCPSSQHHRDSARARTFLRRFVLRGDSASPQRHDGRRLAACFGGRTARKGVTGSHCRAS